ncbi:MULTISPECIES: helix-turn-helix domain-containing protein [Pseudomonas]|jgi:transcriptional regulator with XRE-family HTH domain|uniref:Helix-turn-helix domain-containing protein n=1 Tax=Pseudomonas juntendi TaxID=2666183 RepID=A0ABD4YKT8_9PSED|nr:MULTISPECIES: helix-turn-helix transcriptional regulator [Pseudomonas]MCF1248785.1 helix-turn-helix domain-containing protein [Pseudomonas putida]MDD2029395.1 helix-turn-helix domain-containing protein [Pseudomonas putida]MDF3928948.1 helix-turn-helix transcriptional regulator [Pseudomonas putida]MDH0759168.1 helix-turn-helix domain-containing protein [Pseudomonas juntendi]MDH1573352.1 helix-turn-helix domain-containing protein [Pseudomonas sp. GD03746]
MSDVQDGFIIPFVGRKKMELKQAFGQAMRLLRKSRGLSQEAFGGHTSQTYLSQLEAGGKGPSLEMVHGLASVMNVHPLTILMQCYLFMDEKATLDSVMERVRVELCETLPD